LQEGVTDYLGMKCWQDENFEVHFSMKHYVEKLERVPMDKEVMRSVERPLNEAEKTRYRSGVMRAAWPCRLCIPQGLYMCSRLAQGIEVVTVQHLKDLNKLIDFLKTEADEGRAQLRFVAIDLKCPRVITPFDASFAKELGGKSQGGFITMAADDSVLKGLAPVNLIEFSSFRIHRVVRSTMAAESAALCIALDRQLYARVVFEGMLKGEKKVTLQWKEKMQVPGEVMSTSIAKEFLPGNMVTDARSLYDHLCKTGNLPTERQVLLDLLSAK
jgi:hypothetical protein